MNVASVEKAFALLETLAAEGKPASLQTMTASTGLPKPTAYRLLQSLQRMGYVSRPAGGRDYLLGPRTARLTNADPHASLKAAARPLLTKLHRLFNETVNLGVLSDHEVLYLDLIETTKPLRMIVVPGQNDPFYCTALGKAIASRLDDRKLEKLIKGVALERRTRSTIEDRTALRRSIVEARNRGYAEEKEEAVEGVSCLAVSLFGFGFAQAAISVAVPVQRLDTRTRAAIVRSLKEIAAIPANEKPGSGRQ